MKHNHFHDDSCDFWVLYERLKREYRIFGRLTIAYDLDDTVRPQDSLSCEDVKETIRRVKRVLPDTFFIVFTANPNQVYNLTWLREEKLPYDAINEYPDDNFFLWCKEDQNWRTANPKPKIFYNVFLEDKSFGLKWACKALNLLCNEIESARGI